MLNKKYEFHDYQLSNIIDHALHAVAIDEMRKVFDFKPPCSKVRRTLMRVKPFNKFGSRRPWGRWRR
ncbi:DUF2235 domain-containing protein [Nodosilinea sp. FACHB-141]|nr:DUF2235 domain-containing protein [Nodosilinea sp. FACHB-141]